MTDTDTDEMERKKEADALIDPIYSKLIKILMDEVDALPIEYQAYAGISIVQSLSIGTLVSLNNDVNHSCLNKFIFTVREAVLHMRDQEKKDD